MVLWNSSREGKTIVCPIILTPFDSQESMSVWLRTYTMLSIPSSLDRQFSSEEVMRLLDRFYNLEMLVSKLLTGASARVLNVSSGSFQDLCWHSLRHC